MQLTATIIVVALTLALPGPTNALLAIAGTSAGLRRSAHLVMAAILGYGLAVVALISVAAPIIEAIPVAGRVLRLAAAAVLIQIALSLWSPPALATRESKPVRWGHVFFTTLLNPKALVLAMFVMPQDAAGALVFRPEAAVLLPFLIAVSALGWIGIGAALRSNVANGGASGWIERSGAIILSGFAAVIAYSAFQ